jgi:hypothetical protein
VPFVQVFAPDGTPLWEQADDRPEYHQIGAGDAHVVALAVGDGAVVLSGDLGEIDNSVDAWLMRADLATGARLWHLPAAKTVLGNRADNVGIAADGTILTFLEVVGVENRLQAYSPAGEPLWSFAPPVGGAMAVAPDGSFATMGNVYPEGIDPIERCGGLCPERMLVDRHAADRSLMWSIDNDICKQAVKVAITPDGAVAVLGQCSAPPYGPYSLRVLRYGP